MSALVLGTEGLTPYILDEQRLYRLYANGLIDVTAIYSTVTLNGNLFAFDGKVTHRLRADEWRPELAISIAQQYDMHRKAGNLRVALPGEAIP